MVSEPILRIHNRPPPPATFVPSSRMSQATEDNVLQMKAQLAEAQKKVALHDAFIVFQAGELTKLRTTVVELRAENVELCRKNKKLQRSLGACLAASSCGP